MTALNVKVGQIASTRRRLVAKWTVEEASLETWISEDLVMLLAVSVAAELEGVVLDGLGLRPLPPSSLGGWLFCEVIPAEWRFRRLPWWRRWFRR